MSTATTAAFGVDELAAISGDVWACFLAHGSPALAPAPGAPLGDDAVRASVGISGTWNGLVLLELPAVAATEAARAMLGATEVTDAEIVDAVGELVNMVGGNLKSLVPAPSTLGLPIVVQGAAMRPAHHADEVCAVHLDWGGLPLRISVWTAETGAGNENHEESPR